MTRQRLKPNQIRSVSSYPILNEFPSRNLSPIGRSCLDILKARLFDHINHKEFCILTVLESMKILHKFSYQYPIKMLKELDDYRKLTKKEREHLDPFQIKENEDELREHYRDNQQIKIKNESNKEHLQWMAKVLQFFNETEALGRVEEMLKKWR